MAYASNLANFYERELNKEEHLECIPQQLITFICVAGMHRPYGCASHGVLINVQMILGLIEVRCVVVDVNNVDDYLSGGRQLWYARIRYSHIKLYHFYALVIDT